MMHMHAHRQYTKLAQAQRQHNMTTNPSEKTPLMNEKTATADTASIRSTSTTSSLKALLPGKGKRR